MLQTITGTRDLSRGLLATLHPPCGLRHGNFLIYTHLPTRINSNAVEREREREREGEREGERGRKRTGVEEIQSIGVSLIFDL